MVVRWSAEQVLALAPDASSAAAGRGLSGAGPWSGTGTSNEPAAVWGLCQGSGKNPYQTVVDLTAPAYKCSCPSRKFPCKHALGLLLLWTAGGVSDGEPPDWASSWLTDRGVRATRPAGAREEAPDPEAAAKRAAARDAKVAAGLLELDLWCCDQVRTGLSTAQRGGYAHVDSIAARMVDAQAPGVATALRRLPGVAVGDGWHQRWLVELAGLRLVATAHQRLDELPADLAATVRAQVGYQVAKEDVLAMPGVADTWQVLGLRDRVEDRLTTRRVWLRGTGSGRPAMVLSFAPRNQPLDASLVPGTEVDADLHFYPGVAPLRALVGAQRGEPVPSTGLAGESVPAAYARLKSQLGADPWAVWVPVVLDAVTPVPGDRRWSLQDADGHSVPVVRLFDDLWRLLAVSGGHSVAVAGELGLDGLRPIAVAAPGEAPVAL